MNNNTSIEIITKRHQVKELQSQIDAYIHNLSDSNVLLKKSKCRKRPRSENGNSRQSSSSSSSLPISISTKETSPVGLERQYNELYTLLRRGLLGNRNGNNHNNKNSDSLYKEGEEKKNVSALLLGPRGQGKSLVLERVLSSLFQEWQYHHQQQQQQQQQHLKHNQMVPFRLIRLDGILLRGHDVNVAVREIVRQLSEIASRESFERLCSNGTSTTSVNTSTGTSADTGVQSTSNQNTKKPSPKSSSSNNNNTTTTNTCTQKGAIHEKLYQILEKESYNLRTRKTTFNNSLATLDEALQTACIDSIPILIIMDELDSFLNHSTSATSNSSSNSNNNTSSSVDITSKRHLLLYHLLDRVAGKGSLISMVSSTSRLSTIGMFEKRVRSRAEGTTKIIYFGRPATYDELVAILLSKIDEYNNIHDDDDDVGVVHDKEQEKSMHDLLKEQLSSILLPSVEQLNDVDKNDNLDSDERQKVKDEIYMVRDILKRNFSFGQDVRWFCRVVALSLSLYMEDLNKVVDPSTIPIMTRDYFIDALTAMGGLDVNIKAINVSRSSYSTYDDNPMAQINKTMVLDFGNPRMNKLRDLTGPQITVLLSAKRILYRDSQNEATNIPLTFERILTEYESYFVAQSRSTGPDHYSQHILFRSFRDLLGGFLMPAKDHSGGGPGQYNFSHHCSNVDNSSLRRIALHVNIDMEGEVVEALKRNHLDCTSALRDWGLSGNKSN